MMTNLTIEECERKHGTLWKLMSIVMVIMGLLFTLTAWTLAASYKVQRDYQEAKVEVAVTKADMAHIKSSLVEVKVELTDIRTELRQLREAIK